MPITSFYHAIYKRLWAVGRASNAPTNHKPDDTPKGQHLDFPAWSAGPPPFPLKQNPKESAQILFVCSQQQDNGVRPGSVPANYWNSSLIHVCDDKGKDLGLPVFKAGQQRTIQAVIGNSGNLNSGALFPGLPAIDLICNAYCFNTFLSDSTPLPALSPLDPASSAATYEQPTLPPLSYGVTGFRFDVDKVFKGLADAMVAHGYTKQQ